MSGLEPVQRALPVALHARAHGNAGPVSREQRDHRALACGADERADQRRQRGQIHGHPVAAHELIPAAVHRSQPERVPALEAQPRPYLLGLAPGRPRGRGQHLTRAVDACDRVPEPGQRDRLRALPAPDVEYAERGPGGQVRRELAGDQRLAHDLAHAAEAGEPAILPG